MRRAPALALLVALLVAACGGSTPSGGNGSSGTAAPTGAASAAPGTPGGAGSSGAPTASSGSSEPGSSPAEASAAPAPSDVPSGPPTPFSSAGVGTADVCSGSVDNQTFYAHLAASVSWEVYCAVLPKGWVVSAGQYRLANGGKLTITYRGQDGATVSLSEGSFCTDGSGCVPSGTDAGAASFGTLPGTLVVIDSGGYAIVVARGEQPSWLMVTSGLDQATTVSLGAALAKVSGS